MELFDGMRLVWPEKKRQMSKKIAKNYFTRNMIDFDIFTVIV